MLFDLMVGGTRLVLLATRAVGMWYHACPVGHVGRGGARLVLLASRRPMNRARSVAKAVSDFPRGTLEICCAFDPVDTVKGCMTHLVDDTDIDQCDVPLSTWVGNTWACWANLRAAMSYLWWQSVPTRRRPSNVISAGASISAAKSPVPMEASGIHDMSL